MRATVYRKLEAYVTEMPGVKMDSDPAVSPVPSAAEPRGRQLSLLCLAALGIVYGDLGTSPLYAIRECFTGPHPIAIARLNILGVLSLIFWGLP